ncbi:MAG: molybdopterin cofactor-binding domain-containing protein [Pseudomonadota bacterium]
MPIQSFKAERDVSRRQFLAGTAAAGLGFSMGFHVPLAQAGSDWSLRSKVPEVNAWVVVSPDETVIIRIARSEMGQGTLTGLAQLVAEELECDWNNVRTEYPTPGDSLARNKVWGNFITVASFGIRQSQAYMREGGAAARIMLVEAAADRWGVTADDCSVSKGVISHQLSGRSLTYGAVAADAAKRTPPKTVTLKNPSEWRIAGKPLKRLDTLDKLSGKQIYGADLNLPNMVNAAIKGCPVFGGRIESFDATAVSKMPGVLKVVQVGDDAVSVVADTWWHAKTALNKLPIKWDEGEHAEVNSASLHKWLAEGLETKDAHVVAESGNADEAIVGAVKTVTSVYSYPHQNHAPMEPMNATVRWTPERCEAWCPTQNGEAALQAVATASGLPIEKCEVYKVHLGGGFGRRSAHDWLVQAVKIAKQMPGVPVKMLYSREEDMTRAIYHPLTTAKLEGGLDKDGNITGLKMRVSGQSIFFYHLPEVLEKVGTDPLTFQGMMPEGQHRISYTIPSVKLDYVMRNPHIPPAFWRGVNANQNAIYVESFMDEMAGAAGVDPLEFRRRHMANQPRQLAVLNVVAERGNWGKPSAPNRHQGIAVFFAFDSAVAALAEVSVTDGELKIHKITAGTDPIRVVNPQQVETQVAGSFVYGLSAMLYQGITVANGRVEQSNFDTYPSMTLAAMPEVETVVIESGGEGNWGGIGEPTISVAAPAVLNAVFAATGKRIRSFPLSNTSLSSAS